MQVSSEQKGKLVVRQLKQTGQKKLNKKATIVLFLLPSFLLYLLFVIYPIFQAIYTSLYRWNGLGPLQNFIVLDNYKQIFEDKVFVSALTHNILIARLSLIIQLPMALGLALMVGRHLPGRGFFRLGFFLPYVFSDVVTGVIWSFIYHPEFGLLNNTLKAVVPGYEKQPWLGNPDTVLWAIFAVMCWKYFGLHLVLYVAGLQNIPAELEEAARLDGANGAQILRHITIPLLASTIRLSVFLSILGSLQYFDLIWVMSAGGPVNASETMSTYLIKFGFQRFALGYGSAVAVVLFTLCLAFSLIYQRYVMNREINGAV